MHYIRVKITNIILSFFGDKIPMTIPFAIIIYEHITIVFDSDIHAKDNKNKVDYLIEMQVLKDKNMLTRAEYNNSKIFQTFF